ADIDPAQTLTYELLSGQDSALFTFDTQTRALSFTTAPDFENKLDAGGDNVYNATIRVSDGTNHADLAVAVTVTNKIYEFSTAVTSVAYTENDAPVPFDVNFGFADQDPQGDTSLLGALIGVDAAAGNRLNRISLASSGNPASGLYYDPADFKIYYDG
ncbi:MAG: cadherin repeat domain-containing protein, partial [Planctomycetaceae bacterium]